MKKINHLLVFVMLILGLIQITVPLNNINTSASIPPPPDDGVNGAYVQYIEGYWSVDDTQSYTDEIIVLNGSLSIQSGGSLTLKNVTLAINCTSVDGQYMIVVMSGGSLIITDGDNDPKTTQDASNITDSPFDTDNDTKDYDFEYTFRVYNGGFFSLNNSLVRECGYQRNYYTNGICTETNNVKIENCTFESNYYGIYTYSGNNFEIKNNTFTNNYVGYSSGYSAVNGLVRDNLFHLNNIGMYAGGYDVIVTNNTAHNNSYLGLGIQSANDLNFFNNTMVYNGGTSWTHNLFIGFSDSVEVHNNTIQYLKAGGYHTVMIRDTGNLYFHDNIVTHNDDQAIRCDINSNSDTNIRFIHNNISNNDGSGLTVYGRYNTANYVEVKDNMFYQNQGYGYHFAKLLAYTVTNNTIISTSSGVLQIVLFLSSGRVSAHSINLEADK